MPVPITRTDWRLDRVVEYGDRRDFAGSGPGSSWRYYTRNRLDFDLIEAGPAIVEWNLFPQAGDGTRFILHVTWGGSEDPLPADPRSIGIIRLATVYGFLNLGTGVRIGAQDLEIVGFFDFTGDDPVLPTRRGTNSKWARLTDDGSSAGLTEGQSSDTTGFGVRWQLGIVVNAPVPNPPATATLLIDPAGSPDIVIDVLGKVWVQVLSADSAVTGEDFSFVGSNIPVQTVIETVELIARRTFRAGVSLLLDGATYQVTGTTELARGRFWQVSASRTYLVTG